MGVFVSVAKLSELPPGQVRVVEAHGMRVALCNVDGNVYAVEDRCTHDDGPLGEGFLEGEEIECPRHGARFDVKTGAVRCLPAVVPIRTFKVQLTGDEIQVALE
jgi:3-phenylpropionate/trans-cinnamate dioxygenase ferredoxin component